MINLSTKELQDINGGAITAAFLNAFARAATTVLGIGQIVGQLVRKFIKKKFG